MSESANGRPVEHRREKIVASATKLFSRKGYTSTGIDEIGIASGITGPGVYRHFGNKSEVLSEVARRSLDRLLTGVTKAVNEGADEWEVLEGLVRNMIRSVLDDQAGWVITTREHRHLNPETLARIAGGYGHHMREWARALASARPELTSTEVRVIVRCVSALTAPLAGTADVPRDRVEQLLTSAAMAVLRDAVPVRAPA